MPAPQTLEKPSIDETRLQERAEMETARKQINGAFQTAMLIGGITTLIWLAGISGKEVSGANSWRIIDMAIAFGLGYGISRKSEICAISMLGYFLLSKLIQLSAGGFPAAAYPLSGFIIYQLWNGVVGTRKYNELIRFAEVDLPVRAEPEIGTTSSQPGSYPVAAPTPFQPLDPNPELLALCGGDLAQAQWLLTQIKIKHPNRSVDWFNQRAIEQFSSKKAEPEERE